MKNFEDEFGDDFFGRWDEFNNRMKNDRQFRLDVNKLQRNIEEFMKSMSMGNNFDIRFLTEDDINKLSIPKNEISHDSGTDENGHWESKNWVSPDGKVSYSFYSHSSNLDEDGFDNISETFKSMGKRKEETKEVKLLRLEKALKQSVETENYEKAAELKKLIDELKNGQH